MDNGAIIKEVKIYVKSYLTGAETGHNWWHIERVRNIAVHIHRYEEKGDKFIIELAALLHDVGDHKIEEGVDGPLIVRQLLDRLGVPISDTDRVVEIMKTISFRDSFESGGKKSVELMIVQDADRIDAMGAIGIARAFNYGGSKGNEIWVPGSKPSTFGSKDDYLNGGSSTINHFYEKLLLLKGMMNTQTGNRIATERHRFMEEFLDRFYSEWKIED